jgi:hypothetical protein
LAKAGCGQISAVEGINPTTPINYQSAFDADTLLEDVPGSWDIENLVLDRAFSFVLLRQSRQAATV